MKDRRIVYLKVTEIEKGMHAFERDKDRYELERLTASIKARGIIQPLTVRVNEHGSFEVISGNRRLAAAISAGLTRVPCIVKKTDPLTCYLTAVSENMQRKNLTPFEEAEALLRLINDFLLSEEEVAIYLGVSPSFVSAKLSLLRLDKTLRKRLEAAALSERYAKALLRLPEKDREKALDSILAKQMGVLESERYIEELLCPKKEGNPTVKKVIGDLRLFSNSLIKMVDTMKSGGINAVSEKLETDSYIEYKVTITK